jgi:hypothetical protein
VPSGEQDAPSQDASGGIHEPVNVLPNASDINLATAHESDSFAALFGYVEHSNLNTAAFLRRVSVLVPTTCYATAKPPLGAGS